MSRNFACSAAALVLLPVWSLTAAADPAAVDKSAYTLFNRTPESQLRELTTDRPDVTESPYTVDAGWWQVEMDLVARTHDHNLSNGSDISSSALSFATINLRVGLTSSIDLQTVFATYNRLKVRDRMAGTRQDSSGFGDVTSRLKINFWGNDGGASAFGLLPFVKWPTSQHGLGNNSVEGGLIVPYARNLPHGWDLGAMTEFDVMRNETDNGYIFEWVNTVTAGHALTENISFYVELATTLTHGADLATFDFGFMYTIGKNLQLDVGTNVGLTHAADDLNVFAGLSVRF